MTNEIEHNGFRATRQTTHAEVVWKLLQIYENLGWGGISGGGYPVLRGFSYMRNEQPEGIPVYFSVYSLRSLIYAKTEFAGGETARAIRIAFRDIRAFLNEEQVRLDVFERQKAECMELIKRDGLPCRVIIPNIGWLTLQVAELEPLVQTFEAMVGQHLFGVLYAVELQPDDLPWMASEGGGVAIYRTIPPSRIRHKVVINADKEIGAGIQTEQVDREQWRYTASRGPLVRIGKGEGFSISGHAFRSAHTKLEASVVPGSGEDISLELAERYGTPAVKTWALGKRQPKRD